MGGFELRVSVILPKIFEIGTLTRNLRVMEGWRVRSVGGVRTCDRCYAVQCG